MWPEMYCWGQPQQYISGHMAHTGHTGAQSGQGNAQGSRQTSTQFGWASVAKCTHSSSKWRVKADTDFTLASKTIRNTGGTVTESHTSELTQDKGSAQQDDTLGYLTLLFVASLQASTMSTRHTHCQRTGTITWQSEDISVQERE